MPVLAIHALPAAISTLTGRTPTWTLRTTCGAGTTCSLPPGGFAFAGATASQAGALSSLTGSRAPPAMSAAAIAPAAVAARAIAAIAARRWGARGARGPSGHVTAVALRPRPAARAEAPRARRAARRPAAASSAASAQLAGGGRARFAGRFSSAWRTTSSNAVGTPGTSREGSGGAACRCAHRRASSVSRGYGDLAGQREVQHAAERVDVGAPVDGLAADLLGRDEVDRPHPAAGRGQAAIGERVAGEAEVAEVDLVVGGRAGCWPA